VNVCPPDAPEPSASNTRANCLKNRAEFRSCAKGRGRETRWCPTNLGPSTCFGASNSRPPEILVQSAHYFGSSRNRWNGLSSSAPSESPCLCPWRMPKLAGFLQAIGACLKRTASGASGRADVHRYAAVVAELMTNEEPKVTNSRSRKQQHFCGVSTLCFTTLLVR